MNKFYYTETVSYYISIYEGRGAENNSKGMLGNLAVEMYTCNLSFIRTPAESLISMLLILLYYIELVLFL